MNGEDFGCGYSPHHYSAPEVKQPVQLSSNQLQQVINFLDALDESGAAFSGTVEFDGVSFEVGQRFDTEEHFIVANVVQ